MINLKPIASITGILLIIVGALMFTGIPFSIFHNSNDTIALVTSGSITILSGLFLWNYKLKSDMTIRKREGFLIVVVGWVSMVSFGMLPYLISGDIPNVTDAFFETVSGMTTTGSSILNDIESVPKGILYWRSMTQWIGGMGIIVLMVAIFPVLGIGGSELFVAEAPGPTSDKIHPRIRETAKRLWLIYFGLTATLAIILTFAGMTFYDAINHALTTMATGGFSTKNASIAAYDSPFIQYPIIIFMFLAGTNYTVMYFALKGKFKKVFRSEEFVAYVLVVLVIAIIVSTTIFFVEEQSFEKSFRDGFFQVISIITTTGYVSADYTTWTPALTILFFILLFVGASAGSTAGGIKMVRHLVYFKNSFLEFKRIIHPRAIVPLKISGSVVSGKIKTHILSFLMLYILMFLFGSIAVSLFGLDFKTSIGAVATSLGNVGPGIGNVGPVDNFSALPDGVKWILSFLMLLGRLELYTILVLFTPYFWKAT